MINVPTVKELEVEPAVKPFTGYIAVSHVLMQTEEFADFLFDNFKMVRDLTSSQDRKLGLNRFVMQSTRFSEGYGQYKIRVDRLVTGEFVVASVIKVG